MRKTLSILCIALLAAGATGADAMSADSRGGPHPQPVAREAAAPAGGAVVVAGGGEPAGEWHGVVALSEVVGRVLEATNPWCEVDETEGERTLVTKVAACVLRAGTLLLRGVPPARAAAGVAAESLFGSDRGSGASQSERTR